LNYPVPHSPSWLADHGDDMEIAAPGVWRRRRID
jgi:hypothetical protein